MLLLSRLLSGGEAWCRGCYTMTLECFQKEHQVHRVAGCQGSRKACAGLKELASKIPAISLPAFPPVSRKPCPVHFHPRDRTAMMAGAGGRCYGHTEKGGWSIRLGVHERTLERFL